MNGAAAVVVLWLGLVGLALPGTAFAAPASSSAAGSVAGSRFAVRAATIEREQAAPTARFSLRSALQADPLQAAGPRFALTAKLEAASGGCAAAGPLVFRNGFEGG